ncbi:MAG: hypothetical protein JRC86_08100, partial [Deltaproteobacteria bacterium]|nr:hypothetical protein [Deltaproteobacteria bacterium]
MRRWHYATLFMVAMIAVTVTAAAEIRVSEWKEVSGRAGIVGYTRMTSLTEVEEVKAVGVVEAPVAVIEAVIRDVEAEPQFMFKCTEAAEFNPPGLTVTDDIGYVYNRTSMPWPVNDRDVVVKSVLMVDTKTGTLYVRAHEVTADFPHAPSGLVRMPILRYIMIVSPLGESKSQVYYQVLADPGGRLPKFLVNLFSKNMGVDTIAGLREMVKKEKY